MKGKQSLFNFALKGNRKPKQKEKYRSEAKLKEKYGS
jgi:hypothetical protein